MIAEGYRDGVSVTLDLWPIGEGHWLEREAAQAFLAMATAAKMAGHELVINTSFRSMAYQKELYDRWIEWPHLDIEEKRGKKPPARAARPGYSTHQSGLSVDINRAPGDDPRTPEPDSPVDLWLHANAHKYGFVRDVHDESWHFTYRPEQAARMGAVV